MRVVIFLYKTTFYTYNPVAKIVAIMNLVQKVVVC